MRRDTQGASSFPFPVLTKIYFVLSFLIFFPAVVEGQEWRETKSDHFIVYFLQDEKFAKDVLSHAEEYYKSIASELGYERYSVFWTWDKRVKIYIYSDKNSFLNATGQPAWSEGMANYFSKSIMSYAWSTGFLDSLLPHEIAHLIFRDYVGFKGEIPLWLDEGVAQWMEPKKRQIIKEAVRELLKQDKLISVSEMLALDIRQARDEDLVKTFYIEAMSLVGFLITQHGSDTFTAFCRQLRDGKSFEDALEFSYPTSMRTIEDLEKQWRAYIKEA